jgi:micrococcal nuclease
MILTKSKLNKAIPLVITIVLAGIIGYFVPHKPIIKQVPALYKVVEVIDGDTIKVEFNNKIELVRLLGIDTPEVSNPYKPEECFGKEASQRTKELLEGKYIYLIPDPLSSNRDKYGRLLRYVFLSNGLLINAELIKEGYAFNYIYEPFQLMKQFDYLEKQAKEKRLGLWGKKCNYYFEIKEK